MTKKELKKIANRYGANEKVIEGYLIDENTKLKDIEMYKAVELVYVDSHELLYSREAVFSFDGIKELGTEYLEKDKYTLLRKDIEFINNYTSAKELGYEKEILQQLARIWFLENIDDFGVSLLNSLKVELLFELDEAHELICESLSND